MGKDFKDDAEFQALSSSTIQNLCAAAGVTMIGATPATDDTPLKIMLDVVGDQDGPAWDALIEALPTGALLALVTHHVGKPSTISEIEIP